MKDGLGWAGILLFYAAILWLTYVAWGMFICHWAVCK